MRIYLAGPMRGYPLWNFPAFDAARDYLTSLGHEVISPADIDRANGVNEYTTELPDGFIHVALRRDFNAIIKSEAIAFLPGWESSSGVRAERQVGRHIGIPFYRVDPLRKTFTREIVIGLSGYARAGKDTAAAALVERHGFTRTAFADALRDMLYALNPSIPIATDKEIDVPYHAPLQDLVDSFGWEGAKSEPHVRKLLQRLGTEAGRAVLGQDIWVDTLFRSPPARLVIPDVRFPNEAEAIKAHGGVVIRVDRPGCQPVNGHPSETALDDFNFDSVVHNSADIGHLEQSISSALVNLNIL